MNEQRPFNLIITGLGGQGVYTLTQIFLEICNDNGVKCQCSIFKGGAQKHGTVYSELRFFVGNNNDYSMYSTQILKGDLDLIIGFDPFEPFRFLELFGNHTGIIYNSKIIPFPAEMSKETMVEDPWDSIPKLNGCFLKKNFTEESINLFGDDKMLNFLIGLEVIKLKVLPINLNEYVFCFINKIDPSDSRKKLMMNFLKEDQ